LIETDSQENKIKIIRKNKSGTSIACLTADAKNKTFVITENDQKILDNLK
jgi:hypothetical protein